MSLPPSASYIPPQTPIQKMLRAVTICYAVLLTLLLLLPDPTVLFFGALPTEQVSTTYSHLATFTLLAFLVQLARPPKSLAFWVLMLVSYAFMTEIIQESFVPHRTFGWDDLCQNTIGLFLGFAIAWPCRVGIMRLE